MDIGLVFVIGQFLWPTMFLYVATCGKNQWEMPWFLFDILFVIVPQTVIKNLHLESKIVISNRIFPQIMK